jgi:hypothetical protein
MTSQTYSSGTRKRNPFSARSRTRPASSRVVHAAILSAVVAVAAAILKGFTGAGVAEAILTGGSAFGGTLGLGLTLINIAKR